MDRGYTDLKRLYDKIHKQQAFFVVTRSKNNINYEVLENREVDTNCGMLEDISIRLTGFYTMKKYPEELRMVTYEDFSDGNLYHFLTNNFSQEALTIAESYRDCWKIELFFQVD